MRSDRGSAVLGLSVLFFLVMASAAYYKDNGLNDIARLQREITGVRRANEGLRRENAGMRAKLSSITENDFYVESVARESLGLVKPGEVVYEFVDARLIERPLGDY